MSLSEQASNSLESSPDLAPLRAKWGWIVALGAVYLVAGVIALGSVVMATVVSVFLVGAGWIGWGLGLRRQGNLAAADMVSAEEKDMRLKGAPMRLGLAGRLSLAAICVTASPYSPALAQFSGSTQSGAVNTVEQTMTTHVGSRVSLTGTLVNEIRRAQYTFRDETGETRVRIEYEFWRGREVTNQTTLRLRGRVETDVRGRFVDVYYFQILD